MLIRLYGMSATEGVLFEFDDISEDSGLVVRKAHVRQKRIYRRVIDPKLQVFDYALEIPEDHVVRKLRTFILAMDLSLFDACYEDHGGVPYDPRDCLGAILLGLKEGIRSGGALERSCKFDVRYRYAAGGQTPDKRTFQRVKKRYQSHLKAMHKSVLKKARCSKKACGAEVAVDGTKLPGNASAWKSKEDSSAGDPDARAMESHGRKCIGYNVQIAVDTSGPDRMILGCVVIQDENDFHAMPAILEAVKDQSGELPAQVLADTGYESAQSIEHLESKGVDSLICPSERLHEALRENADGVLVCPAGKPIVYVKTATCKQAKGRHPLRVFDVYQPEGGCKGCPLRASCTFAGKKLEVQAGADPAAKYRNRDRFLSDGGAGAMMRRRLVEQPFSYLKRHTRFDRFLTRGLENVQAELLLWVISYNIFKLLGNLKSFFWLMLRLLGQKVAAMPTTCCIA